MNPRRRDGGGCDPHMLSGWKVVLQHEWAFVRGRKDRRERRKGKDESLFCSRENVHEMSNGK